MASFYEKKYGVDKAKWRNESEETLDRQVDRMDEAKRALEKAGERINKGLGKRLTGEMESIVTLLTQSEP